MVTLILNSKIIEGNVNVVFLDSRGLFVTIIASLATVEFIRTGINNETHSMFRHKKSGSRGLIPDCLFLNDRHYFQ